MAHEVETMFSAREVPWHGLGTVTEDVLTAADAIVAAGLDWKVETHPLYADVAGDKQLIEGRKAIVRDSDHSVLGLVSDRYVPFQNEEAFEFVDTLVDSGEAKYETAGSLRHGKVVFLTMKVPMEMKVAGEDAHDMYLLLRTSHDGSKAISVYVTPIRVVCQNTMAVGVNMAKQSWSIKHISTVAGRLQEARDTLQLTFDYSEEFVKMGNQLVNTKLTEDELVAILEDVIPERPKTPEVIDTMMDLYKNSPTNGYEGTAWGGFNAFTEFMDHYREVRSLEAVFTNIIDGSINTMRNKLKNRLLFV